MEPIGNLSVKFTASDFVRHHDITDTAEPVFDDSFVPSGRVDSQISFSGEKSVRKQSQLLADPKDSVAFIKSFNRKLGLSPEDTAKKNELMKDSVLAFYRATPPLFYNDIFGVYSEKSSLLPHPPEVTVNGDIHIGNFGIVKSSSGESVWGMNDFDQCAKGSPELDLERFASSLVLKARDLQLDGSQQKKLVDIFSKVYCDTVFSAASGEKTPQPYLTHSSSTGAVKKLIEKSSQKDHKEFLKKYTSAVDGKLAFAYDDELCPVAPETRKKAEGALKSCVTGSAEKLSFNIFDVCEKKDSGGSSFGLKRYWVLASYDKNPLPVIVEVKQLMPSAVIDRSGDLSKADGKSIFDGQKTLGGLQNDLSGYTNIDGFSYLVRERESVKATVKLSKVDDFEKLSELASQSAKVIAGSHCCKKGNAKLITDWIGGKSSVLSERLADFAVLYAGQAEADFKEF